MKEADTRPEDPSMRDEYDFSKGVRGKYAERFAQGSNVVVEPGLAEQFPDSESVNKALREVLDRKRRTPKKERK